MVCSAPRGAGLIEGELRRAEARRGSEILLAPSHGAVFSQVFWLYRPGLLGRCVSTTSGELRLRILRYLGAVGPQTAAQVWRAMALSEYQVNRLLVHYWFKQVEQYGRNKWKLSPAGDWHLLRELEDGAGAPSTDAL